MANKAFGNLLAAVNKAKAGGSTFSDDKANYWKAEQDKAGNAFSVIRFLPGKTEDDIPFVKMYNHGFQGDNGRWFIENCPTTIEGTCPVCEANGVLWNSGRESDKEIVRKRKRKLQYVTNILVVQDSKNPDNEGKVFMFKFGQKIFDKIVDKLQPPVDEKGNPIDPDDAALNPFDPIEGANFKLKIRKVEGYANYDKSTFDVQSKVDNFDDVITKIHDLNELVAKENFKEYDALKVKLATVLGGEAVTNVKSKGASDDDDFVDKAKKAAKPAPKPVADSEEDDDLAYFKSLASDDD